MTERQAIFEHEPKSYTVPQFYDEFGDSLPKVAVVCQGYCGDIGLETFSIGQTIRIHTYSSQKRVVAKVLKGKAVQEGGEISIPVDYGLKFSIKGGKKNEKDMTLKELLDKKELPVEVIPSDSTSTLNIQGRERSVVELHIRLQSTYEDKYLLGNAVADGRLYARLTAVPLYLPDLRLSLATGIQGFQTSDWQLCLENMADQVATNVKFDKTFGNPNIAVYSSKKNFGSQENLDYAFRAPSEYYNMDAILNEKLSPKPSLLIHNQSSDVYEVIPAYAEKRIPPKTAPKPIKVIKESTKEIEIKPALPKRNSNENEAMKEGQQTPDKQRTSMPSASGKTTEDRVKDEGSDVKKDENKTPDLQMPKAVDVDRRQKLEPSDIPDLSIAELGNWMRQLRLDKYVQVFEEQAVDGTLLLDLNKYILQNEFHMTAFEALKLLKFATTGHVPR